MTDRCPATYVLDLLGRKWTYHILRECVVPMHFNDILHALPSITNRVLSQELKLLLEQNLVAHQENVYELTPIGRELLNTTQPLLDWATRHKNFAACAPGMKCMLCEKHHMQID